MNSKNISKLNPEILSNYEALKTDIDASLFFDSKGIHGVTHAKRVLFLALTLCELENLSLKDRDLLVKSSIYHDIGRVDDDVCLKHGINSYKMIKKGKLLKGYNRESKETIRYIIENHCISDSNFIPIKNYKIKDKPNAKNLLNIFKDADGLDRVRIGDLDDNYLRTHSSKNLVALAQELFQLEV